MFTAIKESCRLVFHIISILAINRCIVDLFHNSDIIMFFNLGYPIPMKQFLLCLPPYQFIYNSEHVKTRKSRLMAIISKRIK